MSLCKENILTKVIYSFNCADDAKQTLESLFSDVGEVFSYILYYKNDVYKVSILISHDIKYNTVDSEYLINDVYMNIVKQNKGKDGVVTYKQGTLSVLVETFDNLCHSIANEQYRINHKRFEFDDLLQITRLKLCELYNKGYYIHKSLLRQTVFYYLSNIKNKSSYNKVLLSMDYIKQNEKDESSLYNTIEDIEYTNKIVDKEDSEFRVEVLNLQKESVMEIITPRQYDRLLMEYGARATTPWSEKLVYTIKQKLRSKKEASTKQLLDKYRI